MKRSTRDRSCDTAKSADGLFQFLRQARRTLRFTAIIGCACIALGSGGAAHAAEGGSGVYVLGFIAPQAGLMPEPGTYFGYNFYSYKGDATANVSVAGQVSIPGTDLKLPAQATGSAKIDVDLYAHLFTLTHVFTEKVLGGQAGLGVALPYINADLDVSGSGVASLIGPGGNTFSIPISGQRNASDSGVGDTTVTGMLGWHDGRLHYMALLNAYVPTGGYDKNRAVNVGKNHWAIEPMGAVTYLNDKTGLEISAAAGITFNQKNSDTDYRSGDELHLDFTLIQHFSEKFYLGLAGYAYRQLTADGGSGASSDFKGRIYGWGPVIGGVIPLGQKQNLFVSARYYRESGAENRLEGNTYFLTGVVKF